MADANVINSAGAEFTGAGEIHAVVRVDISQDVENQRRRGVVISSSWPLLCLFYLTENSSARRQVTQRPYYQDRRGIAMRRRERLPGQKMRPAVCHCWLLVSFFVAFVLVAISVITFVIENEAVKKHCDFSCALRCDGKETDCWIVLGGGAFVSALIALFVSSLVCRLCCCLPM